MSSYTLTLKSICGVKNSLWRKKVIIKYSMEPSTDTGTFKQDQVLVTHLYALCRKWNLTWKYKQGNTVTEVDGRFLLAKHFFSNKSID